jgi:hypothetical protein
MSWFTSLPGAPPREVGGPVHIPTTNMSLKIEKLPNRREIFMERLRTGEDVAFLKTLHAAEQRVVFRPQPVIYHYDRTTSSSFIQHQWRWALHTYVVRIGTSRRSALQRFALAAMFFFLIPVFALLSTGLNVRPWLRRSPGYLLYSPVVLLVYIVKGFGVLLGICQPGLALYPKVSDRVDIETDDRYPIISSHHPI